MPTSTSTARIATAAPLRANLPMPMAIRRTQRRGRDVPAVCAGRDALPWPSGVVAMRLSPAAIRVMVAHEGRETGRHPGAAAGEGGRSPDGRRLAGATLA